MLKERANRIEVLEKKELELKSKFEWMAKKKESLQSQKLKMSSKTAKKEIVQYFRVFERSL